MISPHNGRLSQPRSSAVETGFIEGLLRSSPHHNAQVELSCVSRLCLAPRRGLKLCAGARNESDCISKKTVKKEPYNKSYNMLPPLPLRSSAYTYSVSTRSQGQEALLFEPPLHLVAQLITNTHTDEPVPSVHMHGQRESERERESERGRKKE